MTAETVANPIKVRCSGCRAIVAYADVENSKRNKIWCSPECMLEPPVTEFEDRNGMWREAVASGISPVRVARLWGSAHSLVYKTVGRG